MTALSSSLISDGTLITRQYDEFLSTTQYSPFPATANSGSIAFTSNVGVGGAQTTNNSSITYGANTDWNFLHNGTQDFTIECWINTTNNITYQSICGTATATSWVGIELALSANNISNPGLCGDLSLWFYRGQVGYSAAPAIASNTIAANTWNHVAVTFKSSDKTVAFYVNGISTPVTYNQGANTLTSFAYSSANSTFPLGVGTAYANTNVYWNFDGYITGFKVAKSILYTSSFSLPKLLPVADSNTVLLLNTANSNNYLLDSSANSYTANTFKPTRFSTEAPYLRGDIEGSGSIQFTGGASTKGNILYYGANTDWNFLHNGTEDYTVECWFNYTSLYDPSFIPSILMGTASYVANQTGFQIILNDLGQLYTSGYVSAFYNNGSRYTANNTAWTTTERPSAIIALPVFKSNTWNHLAYTFESRKKLGRFFINGNSIKMSDVEGYSNLQSFVYSSNNSFVPLSFGGINNYPTNSQQYFYNGKLSNVRVVRGRIVYPFDFILDPKPLTVVPNTVFLLKTSNNITYTLDATGNYTANNQGANTKIYTSPVFSYDTPIANPDSGVSSDIRQRLYSNGSLQLLTLDEVSLSDLVIANTTPYTDSGSIAFNGANSFISYGANTDWTFLNSGTTDWTIETFIYPTAPAPAGNSVTIFNTGAGITGYRGISLEMYGTNAPNTSGLEIYQNDLVLKVTEPTYLANAYFGGVGYYTYGIRKPKLGLSTNTWSHLAVTFKADQRTFNIFINGELQLTVSVTFEQLGQSSWENGRDGSSTGGGYVVYANSAPTNALTIGATLLTDVPTVNFSGYISNFRVTKSLLYTTRKILVPNKILPVQNNTVLLLNTANSNNYLLDSSANNYGPGGAASFSNNTPFISLPDTTGIPKERLKSDGTLQIFKEFDEVTLLTDSGSMQFLGGNATSYFSSEYSPSSGSTATFNYYTFSIEFWFYWDKPISTDNKKVALLNSYTPVSPGDYGWSIYVIDGRINFDFVNSLGTRTILANSYPSIFTTNTWNHLAVVKSATSPTGKLLNMYLNGLQNENGPYSGTDRIYNGNVGGSFNFGKGANASKFNGNNFSGFISNLRIIQSTSNSGTMLYNASDSSIIVPTAPLTKFVSGNTFTKLLLNTNNFNNFLTDGGSNNFTLNSENILFSDKTPFPGIT